MTEQMVDILVDWSVEFGEGEPPSREQQVPLSVYTSWQNNDNGLDDVAEWLTDTHDFLVMDWEPVGSV